MITGRQWPAGLMVAVVASASVYMPAAFAQTSPTNSELANLVKQQAAQIKRLNARLDALEAQKQNTAQAAAANNTTVAHQPMPATPPQGDNIPIEPGLSNAPAPTANNRTAALQKEIDSLKAHTVKADFSGGAPQFSSPGGDITFGIHGRIQYDMSGTFGSDYDGGDYALPGGGTDHLNSRNIAGTEFRRLRLDAEGQLTKPVKYKLELDFAGSGVGLRDVYLATAKKFQLGEGVIYLGSKFADASLDGRTSSKYIWFTERNLVANAITQDPGAYNIGATGEFYGNDNDHISLAVTKGSTSDSNNSSDNLLIRSRAHWDPIATDDVILHVGANGYYQNYDGERTSSLNDNVPIAGHYNGNLRIESGLIGDPKDSTAYGFELAGLTGRFAAGAEWAHRTISLRDTAKDFDFDTYAGQVGYSLTGEKFGYSKKQGVWTHPDVAHPIDQGGIGAWQLMARYQAIQFPNDSDFNGGSGHGTTVGLSWYPNVYVRALLDYTRWQTHNHPAPGTPGDAGYYGADDGNTINARAQVVF